MVWCGESEAKRFAVCELVDLEPSSYLTKGGERGSEGWSEEGREGEREGGKERKKEEGRKGVREGVTERQKEQGSEWVSEGVSESVREGVRE